VVSRSLIAFDTDHIKSYVFGTSKLKEIRGASSILDHLNRQATVQKAESEDFKATTIYANGGSALFLINSDKAELLGKAVQKLYREETGAGASITYAIQDIPDTYLSQPQGIMTVEMPEVLELLRYRLRLAKDGQHTNNSHKQRDTNTSQEQHSAGGYIALPSHPFLCTCNSCGIAYAEDTRLDNDDPEEPEGRYCRICVGKRDEDKEVRTHISDAISVAARSGEVSDKTLWGRVLQAVNRQEPPQKPMKPKYHLPPRTQRPKDFNAFRDFTRGKEYLGLIYADANGMGKALEKETSLQKVQDFAKLVDDAAFTAMAYAICLYLPVQHQTRPVQQDTFPFDVLLVGGDDIAMVVPADKALQVAYTLAEQFHNATNKKYTLSVGIVLAPVKYPFNLQRELADETLKDAKKSGSASNVSSDSEQEQSCVNFVVVTGNTSLSYEKVYQEMHLKSKYTDKTDEFYATLRPYTLSNLHWLLEQLKKGNSERLGRTKLHQMRVAILKRNKTTTILEALALLRNWKGTERIFIRAMVDHLDNRQTRQQRNMGTLFPWYLDSNSSSKELTVYRTPLLDFIELYDFVSS
jgi:hypothetical protein